MCCTCVFYKSLLGNSLHNTETPKRILALEVFFLTKKSNRRGTDVLKILQDGFSVSGTKTVQHENPKK